MKSRFELYKEVEKIFDGLSDVNVVVSGHLQTCPYRTFLRHRTTKELERFLHSYNPEKIKNVSERGYDLSDLPELIFGPHATTQQYSKIGLRKIEELFGLELPKETPYPIVQAILKEPMSLLK